LKTLKASLAIFCFSFALHAAGTWILPLIDRDEPRFAEAAREMIQRSDYVVPTFNNTSRFDKPPLIYWGQVLSYKAFGENDFAARFPSVLAASLLALVIFGWGLRLYDEKTAFWSAVIFTTSLHTLLLAKAAVADMALCLFFTLSLWAGWEVLSSTAKKAWWAFYLSLAFSFLAKGPVALLPVVAILVFAKISGAPSIHKKMRWVRGMFVVLFSVGLWAVPALVQSHGEYFAVGIGKHIVGRSLSPMQGHGPEGLKNWLLFLPFYFLTVFISFYPWSFFIPALIKHFKKNENHRPKEIYLLICIFILFAVFTPLKTKLPHYIFPALPALSLLLAGFWFKEKKGRALLIFFAAAMAASAFVISFAGFSVASRYLPAKHLYQKSASVLKPEMEFASLDFNEPSLVWYFRNAVRGFHVQMQTPQEIADFMKKPGPRFAVLSDKSFDSISQEIDPAWKISSQKGFNIATGKEADLKMIVKDN